jgi:hypothetical protein
MNKINDIFNKVVQEYNMTLSKSLNK